MRRTMAAFASGLSNSSCPISRARCCHWLLSLRIRPPGVWLCRGFIGWIAAASPATPVDPWSIRFTDRPASDSVARST
jgi:hypothetical protein